jgi:hypothetical protein
MSMPRRERPSQKAKSQKRLVPETHFRSLSPATHSKWNCSISELAINDHFFSDELCLNATEDIL